MLLEMRIDSDDTKQVVTSRAAHPRYALVLEGPLQILLAASWAINAPRSSVVDRVIDGSLPAQQDAPLMAFETLAPSGTPATKPQDQTSWCVTRFRSSVRSNKKRT